MAQPRETFYDVLGVPRGAKLNEIGRAYNRLTMEMQKDTWMPDARREARIHEAYAVLSDQARRDAYDKSLLVTRKPLGKGQIAAAVGLVAVVAGGGAFYFLRPPPPPNVNPGRPQGDVLAEAGRSVGRVKTIDTTGNSTQVGIAFTVEQGVMATLCEGLPPGASIVVNIASRSLPGRMSTSDDSIGVCKLAMEGQGSFPLPLSNAPPRAGDRVFSVNVAASGEVALYEGTVKRVVIEPKAAVQYIEASTSLPADAVGGPLFDTNGRVIGIAAVTPSDGKVRHMALPAAWVQEASAPKDTPAKAPAIVRTIEPTPAMVGDSPLRMPGMGEKMDNNRREEMAKALRPDPRPDGPEVTNAK